MFIAVANCSDLQKHFYRFGFLLRIFKGYMKCDTNNSTVINLK